MDTKKQINITENILAFSFIVFACACILSISVTQISFFVGMVAWGYSVYLKKSWNEIHFPLGVAFCLFSLASVLSMVFSIAPSKSVYFFKKLIQAALFFLFLNNLGGPEKIKKLLAIIFVAGGVAGLYSCYQLHETGLSLYARVEGTMSIYITFAGLAMLNSLMVLSFLLFDFSWKRDWWLLPAFILIFQGLVFSLTRGSWVGFLAGMSGLVLVKNKKLFLLVPVVLAVLFLVIPGEVGRRAISAFDPTDPTRITRVQMWQTGVNIFKDHPWTGIGFATLRDISDSYKVVPDQRKVSGLHNNFFQITVDTGVFGLLAWLMIWGLFFWKVVLIYKKIGGADPACRALIMGSAACVAAFLVNGFFEVNFYDSEVAMLVYFLMSIPFALSLGKLGRIPQ